MNPASERADHDAASKFRDLAIEQSIIRAGELGAFVLKSFFVISGSFFALVMLLIENRDIDTHQGIFFSLILGLAIALVYVMKFITSVQLRLALYLAREYKVGGVLDLKKQDSQKRRLQVTAQTPMHLCPIERKLASFVFGSEIPIASVSIVQGFFRFVIVLSGFIAYAAAAVKFPLLWVVVIVLVFLFVKFMWVRLG